MQLVSQQVTREISRVTPHFCNLQRQQNVALRVARKVELSSTFRNVVYVCNVYVCNVHTNAVISFIRSSKFVYIVLCNHLVSSCIDVMCTVFVLLFSFLVFFLVCGEIKK